MKMLPAAAHPALAFLGLLPPPAFFSVGTFHLHSQCNAESQKQTGQAQTTTHSSRASCSPAAATEADCSSHVVAAQAGKGAPFLCDAVHGVRTGQLLQRRGRQPGVCSAGWGVAVGRQAAAMGALQEHLHL